MSWSAKGGWKGLTSTIALSADGTDPVAPQRSWSLPLSPARAGESICSKHHFSSCEVTCSFYSSHLRSAAGGSAPYLPPSLWGNFLCQHRALTDTGGRGPSTALQGYEAQVTLFDCVKSFSLCSHLRSIHPSWQEKNILKTSNNITHDYINFLPIYFQTRRGSVHKLRNQNKIRDISALK